VRRGGAVSVSTVLAHGASLIFSRPRG